MFSESKTHYRDPGLKTFKLPPACPQSNSPLSNPSQALPLYLLSGLQMAQLNSNTDNKVQKLVTVFALPAFYIMTLIEVYPDSAPVPAIKILQHGKSLASLQVCTATLHQCPFITFFTILQFRFIYQLCTATLVVLIKIVPCWQKLRHTLLAP